MLCMRWNKNGDIYNALSKLIIFKWDVERGFNDELAMFAQAWILEGVGGDHISRNLKICGILKYINNSTAIKVLHP